MFAGVTDGDGVGAGEQARRTRRTLVHAVREVRPAKLAATMRGAAIATQIRLCAFCCSQSELTVAGGDEQGLQFIRIPRRSSSRSC